ncbi:MAG: hypothetical protein K2P80_09940 [Beijerinckiaceae bacterium]|nr:hypothetical protein [Beijerinckiaceae bacterium]
MKKVTAAALAVATIGASMTVMSSQADAYYRGRGRGAAVGLGILGGVVAGAAIAGAARPGYGYYDGPAYYGDPAYVVDDGPVCRIERRKVYLDDVTYKIRRVRVCD